MHMKPSKTISRITAHITSLERGTGIRRKCGAGRNSSDRIPPRNIGRFGILTEGRWIYPIGARHGMAPWKLKVKILETTAFSKILSATIILKLKKLGANICNFYHVDSNHIHTDLNHLNRVDLNHTNLNQLIPAVLTTINYAADVCALNQWLSWYRDPTYAATSKIYTRTPLAYALLIHTAHKPSLVHSCHS